MNTYFRYMSQREFQKVTAGVTVRGKKNHKCHTTSSGICFLGKETTFFSGNINDVATFSPVDCLKFLKGIVCDNILVEFETERKLPKSVSRYSDPFGVNFEEYVYTEEYSVAEYNRNEFVPVRYTVDMQNWYVIA